MSNKDIIRGMCAEAFNQAMKSQPVLRKTNIDYSNIKDGQYVARIEDDVAIPYGECLFIKDGLKPAGVVSGGYCINMQTGEVRGSIDDFLKDAKINKTEE